MAGTIDYVVDFYIHDGKDPFDQCPKDTKTRKYIGDFVIVLQHFYPDGTIEFVIFNKYTGYMLKTFNRAQMNDIVNIMTIVAKNKTKLYPKEFLEPSDYKKGNKKNG